MNEKLKDHKDLKEFDFKMLKKIFKAKKEHGDHVHAQRKELVTHRGNMTIKVIWEKDKADSQKFQRKMRLVAIRG